MGLGPSFGGADAGARRAGRSVLLSRPVLLAQGAKSNGGWQSSPVRSRSSNRALARDKRRMGHKIHLHSNQRCIHPRPRNGQHNCMYHYRTSRSWALPGSHSPHLAAGLVKHGARARPSLPQLGPAG